MVVPAPPSQGDAALLPFPAFGASMESMTTSMASARTTAGSDFAALSRRITGEGLMERRPGYYLVRLSVVALMVLGGWTAFFVIGSSWWQLVTAVFLAITFTQV